MDLRALVQAVVLSGVKPKPIRRGGPFVYSVFTFIDGDGTSKTGVSIVTDHESGWWRRTILHAIRYLEEKYGSQEADAIELLKDRPALIPESPPDRPAPW